MVLHAHEIVPIQSKVVFAGMSGTLTAVLRQGQTCRYRNADGGNRIFSLSCPINAIFLLEPE